VNLISHRCRVSLLKQLAAKGMAVDERALVALEEACRKPPPREPSAPREATDINAPPIDLRTWGKGGHFYFVLTLPVLLLRREDRPS
jgi:hypothetical protein